MTKILMNNFMFYNKYLNEDFFDELNHDEIETNEIEVTDEPDNLHINFNIQVSPYKSDLMTEIPFNAFFNKLKFFFHSNISFISETERPECFICFNNEKYNSKDYIFDSSTFCNVTTKGSDMNIGNQFKKYINEYIKQKYPAFNRNSYAYRMPITLDIVFVYKVRYNYLVNYKKYYNDMKKFMVLLYDFQNKFDMMMHNYSDTKMTFIRFYDNNNQIINKDYMSMIVFASDGYMKKMYNLLFNGAEEIDDSKDSTQVVDIYKQPLLFRLFHNLNVKPVPEEVDWYDVKFHGWTHATDSTRPLIFVYIYMEPKYKEKWNIKDIITFFRETIIDRLTCVDVMNAMPGASAKRKEYSVYIILISDERYKDGQKIITYVKQNDFNAASIKNKFEINFEFNCELKSVLDHTNNSDKRRYNEAAKTYARYFPADED